VETIPKTRHAESGLHRSIKAGGEEGIRTLDTALDRITV
jgi:hypothetical protein